ncbi:MAG TPA: 2-dehydro-3-deoxy-D-gluconate 5-dehydrogenase KduD [Symbiobacteriaceae bacterium]|nr:2-dehydro-3-deoxy-D-gluconate 5-dehydrogenase KduD [Symbiobacteriaceae bacterium]
MSVLDLFRLDGKVALVTGGGTGLGQAMALALAEAGADVAIAGFKTGLEETAEMIRARGRRALAVEADLAAPGAGQPLVANVVAQFGRLDILVNNAGTIRRAPALEYTEADWDDVVNINQRAVFFLSQAAARVMVAQGAGKIINIASMLSFQGGILVPSYTASKHAVAGITKALANELAGRGINVNAIAPGYMATANTAPLRADPNRNDAILARIPAGRWGEPSDLMGTVVFLASPASNYVQGHILCVDGGWMVR